MSCLILLALIVSFPNIVYIRGIAKNIIQVLKYDKKYLNDELLLGLNFFNWRTTKDWSERLKE